MSDMFPSIYKKLPIIFCNDIKQIIQQYFNQHWYLIYKNCKNNYFQSNDEEVALLIKKLERYAFNYNILKDEYPDDILYKNNKVIIGQKILKVLADEVFKRKYEYCINESLNKFIIMHQRVNLEYGQLDTYDYLVSIGHNIQRGEMRLS